MFVPAEMHAHIAQIAVLFEDLRLELTGVSEESLKPLETIGAKHRRNYFLRRSVATLVEFVGAIRMLDENRDFQLVKRRFDSDASQEWQEATSYLRKHKEYFKRLRNDFGGHFGFPAAKYAVETLDQDTPEALEICWKPLERRAGPKLRFAGEVAATAMARHKGTLSSKQHFEQMITTALDGYKHCTNCVHLVVRFYLIGRFT